MKKKFYKNLVLINCLAGASIFGINQLSSCSCSNSHVQTITLDGDNFKKANSEGVVVFNFSSNFNPSDSTFNFKLLNYDESKLELKQTSAKTVTVAVEKEEKYHFSVILQVKTDDNTPVVFDLEVSYQQDDKSLVKTFSQLEVIRDIDPAIPNKEPRSTTREALLNENQIAEFAFDFVTLPDEAKAKFEILDNDELSLVDDGIVAIDESTFKGLLKVKLNSNQADNESEYLFNLKISFKAQGLNYEYIYQGFKCIYKIDKVNFISNNFYTNVIDKDETIYYKFSFLHNPSDGKCNVTISSADDVIGFLDGETTKSMAIDPESKLCELPLKLLKDINFNDEYSRDIPFNVKFTFNSGIFNKEAVVEYNNQLVVRLINSKAFLTYDGEQIKNLTNYQQNKIEYETFNLNPELTFKPNVSEPIRVDSYEVVNGKSEYISSIIFNKLSDNTSKLFVMLDSELLQQDGVESFTFKVNTTVHARNARGELIDGQVSFEGLGVKYETIRPIPTSFLQIDGSNTLTGIGSSADLSAYNTLVIPKNVLSIGANAFNNKLPDNITKLVFEDGSIIQHINEGAFEGCSSLTGQLKLPETLYNIASNAFKNCTNLTGELKIPDLVVNLGTSAFEGCNNLTSLKLGKGAGIISNNCFKNCFHLSGQLVIPASVSQINDSAFENCLSLSELSFKKDETTSKTSITQLANKAFYNCKNISLLDQLPASIMWIGKNCFQGCMNLTYELDNDGIIIQQGCAVDESAFSGCNSIKEVSLMANTTIGTSAFSNCVNIEKLFISKDVNKYNWTEAFFNCTSLKTIDLSEFETVPGSWEFGNSSETFSNCAPEGTIIVKNEEIGSSLLQFMQFKGIGSQWTYTVKES